MGCILTKVCQDEDPLMLGDPDLYNCEQNEITTLPSSRVLSLDSSGVSERHQVTPVYKTTELGSDTDSLSLLVYGGGVPGVALETDGADSPELTGTRDGGYKSRNGRLQWGTRCRAGNDSLRRRKENQDAFCVCDVLAGDADATLLSVFDGHGPQGAFVSHFVREQYHQAVAKTYAALVSPSCWRADGHDRHDAMRDTERKGESIECDIITEVFRQASQIVTEILNASEIDISVSGTTAVSILVRKTDLFIANIGDSRAVVAKFSDEQQCYRLHCETKDHKPDVPEECTRIKMHNGRVFDWGSCRVWLQDVDMPGLAMSRSFGDSVAKTVGVIAEPDVFIVETVEFGSTDRDQEEQRPLAFAVLASDGIWEFMTTEECIHFLGECIINTGMSPQDACTALIEEACKRWDSEEDVIDDITAVVVYF
ncbi:putative PPM-type phosphatase domain, protein phosphatase 2C family [Plasmopara halstedii]